MLCWYLCTCVLLKYRDISVTQRREMFFVFYAEVTVQVQTDPDGHGLTECMAVPRWLWGPPCPWAGIPPACGGRSVSLLTNKLPFCKTARLPENHTWLWLKYQECDSVSGICCLHAGLQLCFRGRWHQQHSSRPAYNILKAMQKLINSKYALNLITKLVCAFTFAHAGTKPSSFSSS